MENRHVGLFLFFILMSIPFCVSADESLLQNAHKRYTLEKQLNETELLISSLKFKMLETKKALQFEKEKISQLVTEENQLSKKLEKEKFLLNKQVVLAYRIKDTSLLQTLLTHENIDEQAKINAYVKHLNQSQLDLTHQITHTLASLEKSKQGLMIHKASLETLYKNEKKEEAKLEKIATARKTLLALL